MLIPVDFIREKFNMQRRCYVLVVLETDRGVETVNLHGLYTHEEMQTHLMAFTGNARWYKGYRQCRVMQQWAETSPAEVQAAWYNGTKGALLIGAASDQALFVHGPNDRYMHLVVVDLWHMQAD